MRHKGYNVLFPMAFHITGTPIESISARISRGDISAIELYKYYVSLYVDDMERVEEIVSRFDDPREVVGFFSSMIQRDFDALGYSIDWRRKFTTGDPEYNAFVTWQFIRLREKGYVVQGRYPILFDILERQAVGEDDIERGDEISPAVVEFTAVKFEGPGYYLVAATLRPETLPGVTNVWVRPDATYVKALVDEETWIVSREAAEKLSFQAHEVKILETLRGADLVGETVRDPLMGREVPVLPASFVDPDEATGVVYSVPAHAPYDYAALSDVKREPERYGVPRELVEGLEPIPIIEVPGYGEVPAEEACRRHGVESQDDREALDAATEEVYKAEYYGGVMKAGPFSGLRVEEAKERTKTLLAERGRSVPFYEVTAKKKPVRSRSGGKVIAAVLTDQWFLYYGHPEWKERGRRALASMEIVPEKYRKFFEDTIEWLDKRPCARRRGLGTRLPFDERWIIESLSDSTIYMAFYTVIHKIRSYGIGAESLKPEFWDYVFLGRGDVREVSERTGVPEEALRDLRDEFEYWYPVDQRHTMVAHVSNHLSFFIMHHAALFEERHWPRKITLNEPVIREGVKMSKSAGNVIPLVEIPRAYSADWFRLYSVSAADLKTVMDWRERDVETVGRRLRRFIEILETVRGAEDDGGEGGVLDAWIESRVNSAVAEVDEMLSRHKCRDAVIRAFFTTLRDVETYLRHGGRPSVVRRLMRKWAVILEPFIPHLAEEAWEAVGGEGFVSLAPWPEVDREALRPDLERAYEIVEEVVEDVNNVLRVRKEPAERLVIYVAEGWKYELVRELERVGLDRRRAYEAARRYLRERGEEARRVVEAYLSARGALKPAGREAEREMLSALRDMIRERTGVRVVEVVPAEEGRDPLGKWRQALPGRPAIYLE